MTAWPPSGRGTWRPGALLAVLHAAVQAGSSVKLEVLEAQLTFVRDEDFAVVSAEVVRATDQELR